MRELMGETRIGAALQFPVMRLRGQDLADLEPGMILRLPLANHSAAELRIGGRRFDSAIPVRTGEHRGAQLEGSQENYQRDDRPDRRSVAETMSAN
jgi:flagellar motor switch protein FliM